MALDLSGRTWPVHPWKNPEFDLDSEHLKDTAKYHHNSFVQEGTMAAMPLAFPGITTPMPADECAIVSLAMDSYRMVLGGTATTPGRALREGGGAHLLVALTRGATGVVHDLGVIPGAAACTAVMCTDDRTVYLASAGPEGGKIYRHPRIPLTFDCLQEWGFSRPGYTELALPVEGEGIACAVLDEAQGMIFGISDRTGVLFAVDLDSSAVNVIGKPDGLQRFSRTIVQDLQGNLWGTATRGTLWRFSPEKGDLVALDVRIPSAASRDIHNRAESFALDPATGTIYGSGSSDGFLFAFDPVAETLLSIGKPGVPPSVRCMSVGNDGRLFGICGGDEDIGHLFCYDPEEHSLRDLGVPISVLGTRTYGYVFGSAITGADGELFFGQTERNSHLWVYFPAVRERRTAGEG